MAELTKDGSQLCFVHPLEALALNVDTSVWGEGRNNRVADLGLDEIECAFDQPPNAWMRLVGVIVTAHSHEALTAFKFSLNPTKIITVQSSLAQKGDLLFGTNEPVSAGCDLS